METAPLKSFATWARTALIREVTARIAVVLAPASPERVEQPNAVAALEKAVKVAGGGEAGRVAVADKVAYTWFNRIIALRFMDANGYTGIGVVSPERGRDGGQPEVLAEAKRGNIDSAVVINTRTIEAVTSLLNGARRSDDPQGEAYALLLAEYCRHWNRVMPFIFEREGDFTELLIPANLLADDSVLARAVTVLTENVCQDVEVIGWLYQFYISERKDEVFAGFKRNQKAGAAEIPAATQLFTPHWIVRYLVENSLGRLWLLNRPTSRLAEKMDYYLAPVNEEIGYLKVASPEELRIMDPACGSGHMLTYAFDLLYAIYEEEGYAPSDIPGLILANNLFGTEIDPRAASLAGFALTMKARGRQRTFFNKAAEPNICVVDPISFSPSELHILFRPDGDRADEEAFWNQFENADTYGSLIRPRYELVLPLARHIDGDVLGDDLLAQDLSSRAKRVITQAHYLSQRYAIVVTNPPYMGSKNMSSSLSAWLKVNYARSKSDLMTAFMDRSGELCLENGMWAMINLPSWMFLSSFQAMRESLLSSQYISSLVHLGRGVFGSDFGSVAFVLYNASAPLNATGIYRRLFEKHVHVRTNDVIEALFLDPAYKRYETPQHAFDRIPGSPIVYWMEPRFLRTFEEPQLGRFVTTEGQNKTADNERYLRFHWEVSHKRRGIGCRWLPYAKGGKFRKWYGNVEYVVDWSKEARSEYRRNPSCRIVAEQFWYREGITWTDVSAKGTGFRYLPPGGTFDMAGPTAFLSPDVDLYDVIGVLNSTFVEKALQAINPTVHVQLKDVKALPLPDLVSNRSDLAELARSCVEISRDDWDQLETSLDFAQPAIARFSGVGKVLRQVIEELAAEQLKSVARLARLEEKIDSLVSDLYGQDPEHHTKSTELMTLWAHPDHRYERPLEDQEREMLRTRDCVLDLLSYAVGCMFGRYSVDEPGLVLASQGDTLQHYLAKVPIPSFRPDKDNVIPIVDGDWFEDDIVANFRQFLRAAFGEQHFEENLRFVVESLGVKDLRDYFVKSFYRDHVQRYKKRPIYWLFSSPKGSFNALIYMHRYTPSTVSTVLNEYLREFKAKLEASRQHHDRLAVGSALPRQQATAQKEVDRLRKVLLELDEYEHDVLYPLATQQVQIDLDDGVKANYPKFGAALKKIPGLEVRDE